MTQCNCLRCGYTWIPRTEKPKACPSCQSRIWAKPRKKDCLFTDPELERKAEENQHEQRTQYYNH